MFSCVCFSIYLFFSPKKENISKRKIPTRRSDFIFFSSLSLAESNVAQVGISFYNSLTGIGYSGLLGHLVEVAKHIT